jgi:hypothetical protein
MRNFIVVACAAAALFALGCGDEETMDLGLDEPATGGAGGSGASNAADAGGGGSEGCVELDLLGDGVDQNCDGLDGVDFDGDGHASTESGGLDCNDGDVDVFPGAPDEGVLQKELVFTNPSSTQGTAVAITPDGHVHIGFGERYKEGNLVRLRPRYVTNGSGSWVATSIDDANGSGLSIAMTQHDGVLHTAYSYGLRYASRDTLLPQPFWDKQTVRDAGSPSKIVADSVGGIHVSFSAGDTAQYAFFDGTDWAVTDIVATDLGSTKVALDANDAPSMAVVDDDKVIIASSADGWASEVAYDGSHGYPKGKIGFAIDDAGFAHLLFAVADSPLFGDANELRHATNARGTWQSEKVMDVVVQTSHLAIDKDQHGTLHAAIGFGSTRYYAVKAPTGVWSTHALDVGLNKADHLSFAVDAEGTAHFVFADYKELFHATMPAGNGVDDDCDGTIW